MQDPGRFALMIKSVIQGLPHLEGRITVRKWFGDEMHAFFRHASMGDDIGCVVRHIEDLKNKDHPSVYRARWTLTARSCMEKGFCMK